MKQVCDELKNVHPVICARISHWQHPSFKGIVPELLPTSDVILLRQQPLLPACHGGMRRAWERGGGGQQRGGEDIVTFAVFVTEMWLVCEKLAWPRWKLKIPSGMKEE